MDSRNLRKTKMDFGACVVFRISIIVYLFAGLAMAQEAAGGNGAQAAGSVAGKADVTNTAQTQDVEVAPEQVGQQAEAKAKGGQTTPKDEVSASDEEQTDSPDETPADAVSPAATVSPDMSAIELLLSGQNPAEVSLVLTQFGYEVFRRAGTRYDAIMNVPVGPDYVVGPGDSFTVHMWGRQNDRISVVVDRDGKIALPEVGVLSVSGLPFGKLPDYLESELKRKFTDFTMHITMGRLRTITVFVTGEAVVPGSHTLSSLSTVINAVFAAGGPSKNGTLRKIQLLRTDQAPVTIDLYDFLMGGDRSNDMRLQTGDTIHIPLIGSVVGVAGNVKRPAIYELKGDMTLADTLEIAGGINYSGWLQRVQIERVQDHQRRIVTDFDLSEIANNEQPTTNHEPRTTNNELGTVVNDGDIIKIFSVTGGEQNVIRLEGHVVRPGKYELKPELMLSDVLSYESFLPQVNLEYAEINRLVPPDFHPVVIPFNLGQLLKGDATQDKKLMRFDVIRLYRWDEKGKRSVSVSGLVYTQGEYRLIEGMRIKDLIEAAGGLQKNAFKQRAQLTRRHADPNGFMYSEQIVVDLQLAIANDLSSNILLADYDVLEVFEMPTMAFQAKNVVVSGLVHDPNTYPLFEGMRISDLIVHAGGFSKNAYTERAELTRHNVSQAGMVSETLEVDLSKVLAGDPEQDILLQDYDHLVVRSIPELDFGRTVNIQGQVRFPGAYPIQKGEYLSSIIKRAGGYTTEAYLRGAVFTRESARQIQQKRMDDLISQLETATLAETSSSASNALDAEAVVLQKSELEAQKLLLAKLKTAKANGRVVVKLYALEDFEKSKFDLELENGDQLSVPKMPGIVSVVGDVFNPTALLHEDNKTTRYYLSKVGGVTKTADKKQISIIQADGSVVSIAQKGSNRIAWDSKTRRWLSGGFMSMRLYPGDTIVVPKKLDKLPWLRTTKDITQILFQMALSAGVVLAL